MFLQGGLRALAVVVKHSLDINKYTEIARRNPLVLVLYMKRNSFLVSAALSPIASVLRSSVFSFSSCPLTLTLKIINY